MANTLANQYSQLNHLYDNDDYLWVQFLRDHYQIIRAEHSGKMYIDKVDMNTYRYRLQDYLENNKIPQSFMWFILELNGMNNEFEFRDMDYLIMPDAGYISNLYELYRSTEATKESER